MKTEILEIITQHKYDHISSEQAVSKLLDLFVVSSRTYKGWLTVDKDGTECWHEDEPEKEIVHWDGNTGRHKKLKKGTIAKLGLNVRWEDEEPLKVNWSPYGL